MVSPESQYGVPGIPMVSPEFSMVSPEFSMVSPEFEQECEGQESPPADGPKAIGNPLRCGSRLGRGCEQRQTPLQTDSHPYGSDDNAGERNFGMGCEGADDVREPEYGAGNADPAGPGSLPVTCMANVA
jgi:hypothetical protein